MTSFNNLTYTKMKTSCGVESVTQWPTVSLLFWQGRWDSGELSHRPASSPPQRRNRNRWKK